MPRKFHSNTRKALDDEDWDIAAPVKSKGAEAGSLLRDDQSSVFDCNEIIIDAKHWRSHLPDQVEAIFNNAENHRRFLAAFPHLTPESHPHVLLDATNWHSPPTKPGWHWHTPCTHSPCSLQLDGQAELRGGGHAPEE